MESLSHVTTAGMVESPSSQRFMSNGNQSAGPYTKPTNDYTWCYENSIAVHANSGTASDEYLPQLEVDDKPLIYRQQFESIVNIMKREGIFYS